MKEVTNHEIGYMKGFVEGRKQALSLCKIAIDNVIESCKEITVESMTDELKDFYKGK